MPAAIDDSVAYEAGRKGNGSMKTRILSALVGIVVLLGVLFCPLTWVFSVAAAILAMIAVWELLRNTGLVSRNGLVLCAMLFAGLEVLSCSYAEQLYAAHFICGWLPLILLVGFTLVVTMMIVEERCDVTKSVGVRAWVFTLYGTLGFVALARLRLMQDGLAYVLLPLVISWMSDTGAYFTGYFFGKHKMAPVISPKKTWEGFFGGWVVSVGCAALFGVAYQAVAGVTLAVSPLWMVALALPLAPLSVCGDLLASRIKRRYGIKDYGTIMPGHGGVMDRFDSVVMIAPILWILLWLFA